jgi:hypothetical protein
MARISAGRVSKVIADGVVSTAVVLMIRVSAIVAFEGVLGETTQSCEYTVDFACRWRK